MRGAAGFPGRALHVKTAEILRRRQEDVLGSLHAGERETLAALLKKTALLAWSPDEHG